LTAGETGDFKFCIDNSFSRISNKVVFFELFIDDQTEQNRASVVNSEDAADYEYKLDDFRVTYCEITVIILVMNECCVIKMARYWEHVSG
jgi:emp24/gp25L/p24 family/GOLD